MEIYAFSHSLLFSFFQDLKLQKTPSMFLPRTCHRILSLPIEDAKTLQLSFVVAEDCAFPIFRLLPEFSARCRLLVNSVVSFTNFGGNCCEYWRVVKCRGLLHGYLNGNIHSKFKFALRCRKYFAVALSVNHGFSCQSLS